MNAAALRQSLAARLGSRRSIAWLGVLFLVAIVAQAAYDIVQSHQRAVAATERELDAQSRVIAEQTTRAIQAIDVVIRGVAEQLETGSLAQASPEELHAYLHEHAKGLVQTDGLAVFNADGSLRAVSQIPPDRMPRLNFAMDPPFVHIRDKLDAGLYIDTTLRSPGTGRWVFPIGRRLDRQGRFAGEVGAVGRVEYFQHFYRDTYPDPSTRISLLHRNGELLARNPHSDAALGKRVPGLEALLPGSASAPATVRRLPSPIDAVDHFVAVRLISDYPLVVVVSRDAVAALAPWRAQALATALRTLALGTLAALLLVVVLRQLKRLSDARASLEASEAALRESEERYALAMTGSNEGHWLWNIPERMIYTSAKLAELFCIPGGAQVMPDHEYFRRMPLHPDDRERVSRNRNDHVAGLTPRLDHEFRIIDPETGEVRWIHTRAQCFRAADGTPLRMAGSTVDATQRKRAEMALRESEERYALAMTGSRGGHWVWDAATDDLFVSSTVNELFGLPADTVPGTRTEYLARVNLHPDDKERVLQTIDAQLSGGAARADYEFRVLMPDGTVHWILNRAQRFAGADGRGVRVAGVSVDISERKQAEAERERLELQLRQAQKLEAIGTLAGGIAHDFNNILSAILGYGELALRDAPEGSRQRRHIDAAMSAGQRAKSLVERILAFSRSGMGERVPVHVQSVLEEALDAVAASLPAGVRLQQSVAVGNAGVTGDATQLHQVVLNLCANAVQAVRQDGEVVVRADTTSLTEPTTLTTRTLPPGAYVRLLVQDSGSGIAPQLLERIFDPFFTTKEVGVGTGLGLSLVHGIVTDLGGGIAIESEVGQGSRFTVWLPCHDYVAAPAAAETPVALGSGESVLLVDDEEPLVKLAEEMLAELGYEPVGFASSTAALEAFAADPQRFDLVLSDEAMPGMTGSELAAEIRSRRPDIPIVLMSGFVSTALSQRARELGVSDVLSKPLASRDIARALAATLRRDLPRAAM